MRLLRRFLCVAIAALAITVVAQAQDMQEGRLPDAPLPRQIHCA